MNITVIYDYFFKVLSEELLTQIREAAPEACVKEVRQDDVTVSDLIDADVVYGRIPQHMLIELPNLKWQHLASAGANGLTDIALYANKSILLTKSSGTFGIPMAEYIVGMMIAISRDFSYYYKKQKEKIWWEHTPDFRDIYGSTVLIFGLGDIGTEVCRHLSSFNCRFIGFRYDTSKPHELITDIRPISKLRDSLPEADYIIVCAPGTTETEKTFGREEFILMKDTAIIINVGRGMIIDTDALAVALNEKQIYGAGLDVTEPEPLPAEHPLWNARNALITPHVSAITQLTTKRRVMVFLDLLKRYITGQEMYNIVNFDTEY